MDQDLDDLFGDQVDVPPIHIPQSLPKGLLQHVDDLRSTGCCLRIAWSKTGCIAYLASDGRSVYTRQLFCRQDTGKWTLSNEIPIKGVSALHGDYPIIHLSWNHQGSDLALFDSLGRISILTQTYTLSDFAIPKRCIVDTEDQLGVAVGHIWLNTDKPSLFHEHAVKEDGYWKMSTSTQSSLGPYNPTAGASALVMITKNGIIRLLLQGKDRTWQESKTELDTYSTPRELLTHATIAAHKDSTLLIATHTHEQHLRFYCVSIDFQDLSFKIQHLKTIIDCFPKDPAASEVENGAEGSQSYSGAHLTHLEYFPQGPENRTGEPSRPFVLGSFTNVTNQDQINDTHEPFSVVCRWELQSAKPKVHPNFENLGLKKSTVSASKELPTEICIRRLPDTYIPKIFLSVQQMRSSTILVIAFDDGSMEFRDRITMELISQNDVHKKVSGLAQIGFEFIQDTPPLQIALSPNFCVIVSLNASTDISFSLLEKRPAGPVDPAMLEATTEALILQFATACTSRGQHHDDLLAVMQLFSEQYPDNDIRDNFLAKAYSTLEINLDHAIDSKADYLFMNPMIQRCFGIQLSLGFQGEHVPRSLRAKVAQGFLDVRAVALAITYSVKNVLGVAGMADTRKADELNSITGCVAWAMSFMSYMISSVFELHTFLEENPSIDHAALKAHIHTTPHPALPLLLISPSRSLLKYLSRSLHGLAHEARITTTMHAPLRAAFSTIVALLRDTPVQVLSFEKLVLELDKDIKSIYQSSPLSDTERRETEKRMLVQADVPEVLMPAVRGMLGRGAEGVRREVDVQELWFGEFDWLGFGDDTRCISGAAEDSGSVRRGESPRVDTIRRVMLGPEARVKRCTRCCAVVEDRPFASRNMAFLQGGRACLCGDWWMNVESVVD